MVRVVGKEGALAVGLGGNRSSGMDGSETITRRYPGRESDFYYVWRISIVGEAFKQEKSRGKYLNE